MKRKVKILSLIILAVLIVLGGKTKVFAANITQENNRASITVSNLEKGVEVNIYRLLSVNYDYEANQPKDAAYTWNAEVKKWVDSNFNKFSDPENFYKGAQNLSSDSEKFYDNLTNAIKSGKISITPTATKSSDGVASYPVKTDKSVVFDNQEMGTYLVIIENGYKVYRPSVVNLVPTFNTSSKNWTLENQSVTIKATNPEITKYVTNSNKTKDNYSTKDTINYIVEADVPKYLENSLSKDYYISDKLENGLTLNNTSVKISGIKGDSSSNLTEGYEINFDTQRPNKSENLTFVIKFDYDKIKNFDKIKVEYSAKLNQNIILGGQGNSNVAYLDYTNNPYEKNSMTSQETGRIYVYTYGIEVEKIDKNDKTKKLSGAEFTLSTEGGDLLSFVQKEQGVYYLSESGKEDSTTKLVVNSEGKLVLNGLDAGKYILKETHAPDGYNISVAPATIEIKDADVDGNLDGEEDGVFSLQFPNTKGFLIPLTGERGSVIFMVLGVVFIILGLGVILIAYKKKNKKN